MCTRITLTKAPGGLFGRYPYNPLVHAPLFPRYNVGPTERVATVLNLPEPEIIPTRWGMIPSWAKDMSIGTRFINLRTDTIAERPAFRSHLENRRCIVLADGYYLWKPGPAKTKQAMLIRLKSRDVFALAGLWDEWQQPDHSLLRSATVITTNANSLIAEVHDRMPVILPDNAVDEWLAAGNRDSSSLLNKLVPLSADLIDLTPVGPAVNKVGYDSPECIEPLKPGEPQQLSLI